MDENTKINMLDCFEVIRKNSIRNPCCINTDQEIGLTFCRWFSKNSNPAFLRVIKTPIEVICLLFDFFYNLSPIDSKFETDFQIF